MMIMSALSAAATKSNFRNINIHLGEARRVLRDRGFTVRTLRFDAWTLSCLPRVIDGAHKQDIYWKSSFDQMVRLIDVAKQQKEAAGITYDVPIHLPSIEQLRMIGADGLRRILDSTEAMDFFRERVISTHRGFADLSILPFIFDTYISSKQKA